MILIKDSPSFIYKQMSITISQILKFTKSVKKILRPINFELSLYMFSYQLKYDPYIYFPIQHMLLCHQFPILSLEIMDLHNGKLPTLKNVFF